MKDREDEIVRALRSADPAKNVPDALDFQARQHLSRLIRETASADDSPPGAVSARASGAFRTGRIALAAAAAVAVLGAGTLILGDNPRQQPGAAPLAALGTYEGLIGCSEAIVEGDVVASVPSGPGRIRLVVRVTEWLKPSSGPAVATFDLVDPEADGGAGVNRPFRTGDHLLLRVPMDPKELVTGHYGEDLVLQRNEFRNALPRASGQCEKLSPNA